MSQHRFVEALRLCVSWTVFSLENAILGILWFGVIPLLAGLFVEKTWWIHFRNPEKEFSLYILYQVRCARGSRCIRLLFVVGGEFVFLAANLLT